MSTLEQLAYALDANNDATMMQRYSRGSAWWLALQYLGDDESLAKEGLLIFRQFLTLVYLSESSKP